MFEDYISTALQMTNKSVVNIGGGSYFQKSLYEMQKSRYHPQKQKTAEEIIDGLVARGAITIKE